MWFDNQLIVFLISCLVLIILALLFTTCLALPTTTIIYDSKLYLFLKARSLNEDLDTNEGSVEHLELTSQQIRLYNQFSLVHDRLFKQNQQGQLRLVPTEVERQIVLREQHHLCGHGGIDRIEAKISEQYWWQHLNRDVKRHIQSCEICTINKPVFSQQPDLHPTGKGDLPFQILAADLITNLQDDAGLLREEQEDPLNDEEVIRMKTRAQAKRNTKDKPGRGRGRGRKSKQIEDTSINIEEPLYKHCIVVIDVFSKYVELGALKSKGSEEILHWFDTRIICRYGSPYVLRTDQGTEFKGALKILCDDHRIELRNISSHHPQANGQVEATVKIVTSILRKFLLSKHYQYLHWWDILPYVQRSINISKTTATQYTPHEILYGRQMNQTNSVNYTLKSFIEGFPDLTPQQVTEYVQKLQTNLQDLSTRVKVHLKKQDDRMIEQYKSKPRREIEFQEGQRVYLQKLRTNKLEPRVLGPFIFKKYTDNRIRADVINPDNGKVLRYNTNTLSPASSIQFIYF